MPENSFNKISKIPVLLTIAMIVIIAGSGIYFKSLYNRQVDYLTLLQERQVRIAVSSISEVNRQFNDDIRNLLASDSTGSFISDQYQRAATLNKMRQLFSKYENIVTGIKIFDNRKNELTLKRDESGNDWLEQHFVLHLQGDIDKVEELIYKNRIYEYYIPLKNVERPVGNVVITLDFQNYFKSIFPRFGSENSQWQWVLDDSAGIVFSNNREDVRYSLLDLVSRNHQDGGPVSLMHTAGITGKNFGVLSSYYHADLLKREFNIVFSTQIDEIKNSIIGNSLLFVSGIIFIILLLGFHYYRDVKETNSEAVKLRASIKKYHEIFDMFPVGIVIYDQTGEVIRANGKAAELFSLSGTQEMKGMKFPLYGVNERSEYFAKHYHGNLNPEHFLVLGKEKEQKIICRTSLPVRIDEKESTVIELLADVTEIESARKNEATASTAKTEFLARMSYELRTPLNGILGMADILDRHDLSAESAGILKLLRRSAEVLLGIINDILDFSKIEAGHMILDEIPFNLREEIVYCYDLARANVDESQISFTCSVNDDVPDKLIGDPFRIRQILSNFINYSVSNTRKGKINLNCSLGEFSGGEIKLKFKISDTGKSFDEAALMKIFGSKAKIDSRSAREDDDSGFGLILARQLISLMKGEFSVVSPSDPESGSGISIDFTLGLFSNEKPEKMLNFNTVTSFAQIRTLAITGSLNRDEEILGSLHKLGLSMTVTTFQKSTVNQIKTSLDLPGKNYHLIIILDDKEFNGFEAAKEIKEKGLSDHFTIMIVSSNNVSGNLVRGISYGIDHYIVKPYNIKELYEAIKASFPFIDREIPAVEKEVVRKDLKILVVEDNKMNQKVIGTMLKSLGYSYDFADDGFAGLIQAKTRRYDVIFMDLIMPQMDGFESARRILEYDNTRLIVAFTADNMPDSKRKAELSGIKEFISKPIRMEDLRKFFARHFLDT